MDWRQEYEKKTVSAEEAANKVKSGDLVVFTSGREARTVGLAISARKEELKGVRVVVSTPTFDFGWYDEGWQDSFDIIVRFPTGVCQEAIDSRRVDLDPGTVIPFAETPDNYIYEADVLLTEISTPDDRGFCSFGASLWAKKKQVERAKLVIAEVNKNLIRPYGDNFVHVSDIDFFVEHYSEGTKTLGTGSLAGRELKQSEPYLKDIAGYVSELIKDGDTLQIGVGRTTEPLVKLGLLDSKHNLGWHSEATPPGVISLVRNGTINGKLKTLNPGKAVITAIGGSTREEMDWVNGNPMFYMVEVSYLEDISVIAAHDNMVTINNALAIDLGGQVTAESIGTRLYSTPGGQTAFALGALFSKGGRSIMVMPATARDNKVSRVLPKLPESTIVTIPRSCVDYVVTEYGIAHLQGKTLRQRANELIAIAHPDFRNELKREAQKVLYP